MMQSTSYSTPAATTLVSVMRLAGRKRPIPLLDVLAAHRDVLSRGEDGWTQLASLERVEVYQATGMIVGALDVDPTDALVRLRAYAYARDMTAGEVARSVIVY